MPSILRAFVEGERVCCAVHFHRSPQDIVLKYQNSRHTTAFVIFAISPELSASVDSTPSVDKSTSDIARRVCNIIQPVLQIGFRLAIIA